MGVKRKYTELDIVKKKKIVDLLEQKVSQRNIAIQFGISKTTVVNIGHNKDLILKMWNNNCSGDRKRKLRKTEFEGVNLGVLKFFELCRSKDVPVSGVMLKKKSLEIAKMLGINEFRASNGWLESFLKRNNISFKALCGDAASADLEEAKDWNSTKLQELIAGYDPKNIFNADELALFYRQIPKKSFVKKGDRCKGGKMAKECLSVLLCCSLTGEKFKSLVIGSAARPRVFKKEGVRPNNLPVFWRYNKKAWMTRVIFDDCHNTTKTLSNVTVQFFPPNLTSEIQPLDQGIIKTVKDHYRSKLLEYIVSKAENCDCKEEFHKSITVLHAIRWLYGAWMDISQQTIEKCFHRAGFVSSGLVNDIEERETILTDTTRKLPSHFTAELATEREIDEADKFLPVHEELPDDIDRALNDYLFNKDNNDEETEGEKETDDEEEKAEKNNLGFDDALKCVKDLIKFCNQENYSNADSLFTLYNRIEEDWIKKELTKLKQTKLDCYLNKSDL
ncbi:tigger transposable element-derived protein 6-like [Cotesia glomerata]|uniref:tigger transposable element-derived protein 6-like n=1 Tax=Cotesia glomerata TaxID=32391 RepID=UPI001D01872D|nr:tigger transposable element-derived protein 6-like [Cotesia glomerata]